MDCIKYVIAEIYGGYSEAKYEFVAQLAHEFKGMKEVVGYLPLEHAIHFNSEAEAKAALETQPSWVKERHKVVAFMKYGHICSLRIPSEFREICKASNSERTEGVS